MVMVVKSNVILSMYIHIVDVRLMGTFAGKATIPFLFLHTVSMGAGSALEARPFKDKCFFIQEIKMKS